jgi:O-antigen/teichoic acid export membrane protein
VAGILIQGLDRAVAARLVSLPSVTTLTLTGRLYYLAFGLLGQITNTARPALGQLLGRGDKKAALVSYLRIAKVSTGLSVLVALTILAGNSLFVSWWVGSDNYGGVWLDVAFAANLIVNCWILPNRATLAAGLVVKQNSLSRLVEGLFNIACSVVLGLHFGLPGVVFGTTVACLLSSFWYLPWLTAKMFEVRLADLFRRESGRLGPTVLLIGTTAVVIRSLAGGASGPLAACATMLASASIGAVVLWFLGFSGGFRTELLVLLRSRIANVC